MTDASWMERADWPKCDQDTGPFDSNQPCVVRFIDGEVESGEPLDYYWGDDPALYPIMAVQGPLV